MKPTWLQRTLDVLTGATARIVVPAVLIMVLAFLLSELPFFWRIELMAQDAMTRIRHQFQKPPDKSLFLVAIENKSIENQGVWPFPRHIHGELMKLLAFEKPAVIGWDVFFSTPSSEEIEDAAFIEGITQAGAPVITGAVSSLPGDGADLTKPQDFGLTEPLKTVEGYSPEMETKVSALLPFNALAQVSKFGVVDCPPDLDGIRRRVPLVVRFGDRFFSSLSLQLMLEFWKVSPDQVKVVLGKAVYIDTPTVKRTIPIDIHGRYQLNYRYDISDFDNSNYIELAEQLIFKYVENKANKAPDLKGKLILVGGTSEGVTDMGASPLASVSALPLVHMNALDNIMKGDFLTPTHRFGLVFWGWLIIAAVTLWGNTRWPFGVAIAVPAFIVVTYIGGAMYLFVAHSVVLLLAMPVLTFIGLHVVAIARQVVVEQHARNRIRATFASYLSPNVMETVLKNQDDLRLQAVRKPVTILFSDVRNFTSLSESGDEEDFIEQLNEYFTVMVDCVNRFDGTLHKFIGDAVMAVWGDTISRGVEKDAESAVNAALAMREELVGLNEKWSEKNRPQLKIGIGLNHGTVLVGDIGAPQRKEFTVMGDPVNLASRLEGVTKEYKNDLVISESVHHLTEEKFIFRTLGFVQVKGKTRPVKIYDVLGRAPGESSDGSENADWLARYEEGFNQYISRRFKEAAQTFSQCIETQPEDYCCARYLEACRELIANPPEEGWNGVFVMKDK